MSSRLDQTASPACVRHLTSLLEMRVAIPAARGCGRLLPVSVLDEEGKTVVQDGPRILAFFSMTDARKRLHGELIAQTIAAYDGVLATAIPMASDVESMAVHRAAIADFAPRGRAGRAYAELQGRLGAPTAAGQRS